jgi:hypothetical protein
MFFFLFEKKDWASPNTWPGKPGAISAPGGSSRGGGGGGSSSNYYNSSRFSWR